jgi:hydroxymethylpyrimidine pyrophosphatase-like HAD family hydrolase
MIIAIDFDGTIVENKYPKIGREILFAIDTLKALNQKGHQLILWTFRTGKELEEAVAFCEGRGVEFYAVNKSYPEEVYDETISRKINVDLFIDDRNIGGMLSWGTIYQMICPEESGMIDPKINKGLLKRIFG